MKLNIPTVDEPDWGNEDNVNAEPVDMTVSVDIAGLTAGVMYTILRFESPLLVPSENFVESLAWTKSWQITAQSDTEHIDDFDTFRSDSTTYYRVIQYDQEISPTNEPACN